MVPVEGNPTCSDDPALPSCIPGVNDLGAIDIARGRDHGMPTYNELRRTYGLPAKKSFKALTGESSEAFPADPQLTRGDEINDPDSLDFTKLYDINGKRTTPEADNATRGVRRTPVAARLKGVYGNVNNVDAFIGMMSEPHLPGRDFGELQLAIWQKQFQAMRDGDRFFYANDPLLPFVRKAFGIDYRKNLGDIIALNTDIPRRDMARNVFLAGDDHHRAGDHRGPALEEPKAPAGPNTRAGSSRAATFHPAERPVALWLPGTAPAISASRSASGRNRRSRRARNRGDVSGEAAV
ncbi:peroxidase family protein [Phytohabitans flavus]|uniref:peroxidase family protein n=1 Tax=Phytohabitans flavus TaxID=1076124 RepID=UPI003637B770